MNSRTKVIMRIEPARDSVGLHLVTKKDII